MDDQQRYDRARERVVQLRGLYVHFAIYVIVNAGLLALNLIASPGSLWVVYVMVGWGIGLAAHALYVFVLQGRWGSEWEERKIREEMERDQRR